MHLNIDMWQWYYMIITVEILRNYRTKHGAISSEIQQGSFGRYVINMSFVSHHVVLMIQFFLDQSYVLEIMHHEFQWMDNNIKLRNVVVGGDTRSYKTTTFIRTENAHTLPLDSARRNVIALCDEGPHISPIAMRVLYGKGSTNEEGKKEHVAMDRAAAVEKLETELESINILDLVAAGLQLFNALLRPRQRLTLRAYAVNATESGRRSVIDHNWKELNAHYSSGKYDPNKHAVNDICELIVKIHWLSFYQVPEKRYTLVGTAAKRLLTWKQFRIWLRSIMMPAKRETLVEHRTNDMKTESRCCCVQ